MTAHDERTSGAGWKRVADELSASPPEAPSPFARERMARGIEARRGAGRVTSHRVMPIALAGAVVAAGVAALIVAWRTRDSAPSIEATPRIAVVSFEGAGGATAEIAQGGELRTAPGLVASMQVAGARVTAESASAMRLTSLDPRDVRVSLLAGSVRVAFHPSSDGDRVTIRTRDADVVVVGTVFRVEVVPEGTRVSVSEGRVRVTDRSGRPRDATPGHDVFVRGAAPAAGSASSARVSPPSLTQIPSSVGLAANSPTPSVLPNGERVAQRGERSPSSPSGPLSPNGERVGMRGERVAARGERGSFPPASVAPSREDAPQSAAPDPRSRLAAARALLERGQHAAARAELGSIGSSGGPTGIRVEAWTLLAESHQSTGGARAAAGFYERAATTGRGTAAGGNARFAQARLLERRLGDATGARAAYRRYLSEYPRGALRRSAIDALCRLGDAEACGSRAETE